MIPPAGDEDKAREIVESVHLLNAGFRLPLREAIAKALADARIRGFREGRDAAADLAGWQFEFKDSHNYLVDETAQFAVVEFRDELEKTIRALGGGEETFDPTIQIDTMQSKDWTLTEETGCRTCHGSGIVTIQPHPTAPDLFPGGEVRRCGCSTGAAIIPEPKCWHCSMDGPLVYKFCGRPNCGEIKAHDASSCGGAGECVYCAQAEQTREDCGGGGG